MKTLASDWEVLCETTQHVELPKMVDAAAFCAAEIETPDEIIKGILHRGCKAVIGGTSKMRKTFLQFDLALAVSSGSQWLKFPTTKARVLMVNLELPPFATKHRLLSIAEARQLQIEPETFVLWNLRGHAAPYKNLMPQLIQRLNGEPEFGLIILDPIYKVYGDSDENSASDTALLVNELERVATETGAAIMFNAHFAKGNAAQKEPMDRISGSGVFARDPDTIIVCTELQTPDAFGVEVILRTMPPQPNFAIRWNYPIFEVATDLDPNDLKRRRQNLKPTPTADQMLELFTENIDSPRAALMTAVELRYKFDERGWSRTAAPAVRERLVAQGKLKIHYGPHNSKLTGLPRVVDAYEKELARIKR